MKGVIYQLGLLLKKILPIDTLDLKVCNIFIVKIDLNLVSPSPSCSVKQSILFVNVSLSRQAIKQPHPKFGITWEKWNKWQLLQRQISVWFFHKFTICLCYKLVYQCSVENVEVRVRRVESVPVTSGRSIGTTAGAMVRTLGWVVAKPDDVTGEKIKFCCISRSILDIVKTMYLIIFKLLLYMAVAWNRFHI